MSSSIPIIQSLTHFASSPNYCQPIALATKMQHFQDPSEPTRFNYESISNNIEIVPPSVWFSIEEGKCFASIRNDIERSRATREGLLSTNLRGNQMNKISYQDYEEDLGAIQESEQSFCVAFAVVKDTCDQFLKRIGSELRTCLMKKSNLNLIDRSHLKISQLEEIAKEIYSQFRIFLIFDTRSQPERIVSFHSCFYPNVRFVLEKIKKREGITFSPNQVFRQIQSVAMMNTFGFLSLDSKKRLLMIKKDDPQLRGDNLIGVWIITNYHTNRTRKQFSKEDAIWASLLNFYTNPDIKTKLSLFTKSKALLVYFNFKKQRNKIDAPQFYLFEPSTKTPPKWNFAIKNQVLSDSSKSCQIKIEFVNSTIVQQREYSQFSDQTTNIYQQTTRMKNENINRENTPQNKQQKMSKNNQFQGLDSRFSGSSQSQGKNNENGALNASKKIKQEDDKDRIIKELKQQLEKYKQRVIELQAVNKVLMQQKMMNPMLYQSHLAMMGHQMQPVYPHHQQFAHQMPGYGYPLSYSQVSGHQQPLQQQQFYQTTEPVINNLPVSSKGGQTKPNDEIKKPLFAFPDTKQEQITFGNQQSQTEIKPKLFVKKSQSYGPELQRLQQQKNQQAKITRQQQKQTANSQNPNKNPRKDMRNISFQDSFAEYHSDGEEEVPTFKAFDNTKFTALLNKDLKKQPKHEQVSSNKKKSKINSKQSNEEDTYNMRSPEFKRLHSLQSEAISCQEEPEPSQKSSEARKQVAEAKKQNQALMDEKTKPSTQKVELREKEKENTKQFKRSPEKSPIKYQQINKKYSKNQQSSDQSDRQQKKKSKSPIQIRQPPKQQPKKQHKKSQKKKDLSSSDSDQDLQMQKIRKAYLNR